MILTEIILGKAVGIVRTDIIQRPDRNGIHRGNNALVYRSGILILAIIVFRPVSVCIGNRQILEYGCRCHGTQFKRRRINGKRLLGGTGLQFGLSSPVISQEGGLFSHAAGQRHHISGGIVNHHNGGLKLLGAVGFRNAVQIAIDGIHLVLHVHVQRSVDVVATLLNPLQIDISCLFFQIVPIFTVLLCQIGGKIHQNRIHKPAVNVLRSICSNRSQSPALRTIICTIFTGKRAAYTFVPTGLIITDGPAVFIGNTLLEDHFLGNRFLIFFLGQVALIVHFTQNIQLTVPVSACAVPFLSLVHKHIN